MATRDWMIELAVMAFIAVVLALLGPFGMFAVPLPVRLLYWLLVGVGGYLLYMPAMRAASRLAPRLELPEPALWAAACALVSVPMTALIWLTNGLLGEMPALRLEAVLGLYGNILIVAGVVCLVFRFVGARRRMPPGPAPTPTPSPATAPDAPAAEAPFLDRLPPHLGRDLLALEMEDHYVRAHTPLGSALILLRLRDAVAELAAIDGAQVHRSWWVARGAVERTLRDGRNVRLALRGGLVAPVARNVVPELKAQGWLR